jgi:hypothetical protein
MMDESELFWSEFPHIGEFASPEDIARLEAPLVVERALEACRRKLRFCFLSDEREPKVRYDKRERNCFTKRFPRSDYAAATRRINAMLTEWGVPPLEPLSRGVPTWRSEA